MLGAAADCRCPVLSGLRADLIESAKEVFISQLSRWLPQPKYICYNSVSAAIEQVINITRFFPPPISHGFVGQVEMAVFLFFFLFLLQIMCKGFDERRATFLCGRALLPLLSQRMFLHRCQRGHDAR